MERHYRHLVGNWLGVVVELTVSPHCIGLFVRHQVSLVFKSTCKAGVARLSVVQGEAWDPYLSLTRSSSTHLLLCRYSVRPPVPTGQALYLIGLLHWPRPPVVQTMHSGLLQGPAQGFLQTNDLTCWPSRSTTLYLQPRPGLCPTGLDIAPPGGQLTTRSPGTENDSRVPPRFCTSLTSSAASPASFFLLPSSWLS